MTDHPMPNWMLKLPIILVLLACPFVALAREDPANWQWNVPLKEKIPGVRHQTIESPSMKRTVGFNIYLPPNYESDQQLRYPVVYFLHEVR